MQYSGINIVIYLSNSEVLLRQYLGFLRSQHVIPAAPSHTGSQRNQPRLIVPVVSVDTLGEIVDIGEVYENHTTATSSCCDTVHVSHEHSNGGVHLKKKLVYNLQQYIL